MIRIPTTPTGAGSGGGGTANVGLAVTSQFVVAGSPVVGTGTITLSMQTSTVAAGTYGTTTAVPQFAVNAFGQITSASSVSIAYPAQNTHSVGIAVAPQLTVANSPAVGSGTISVALQTSTVAAGTYGNASIIPVITFNAFGQATTVASATVVAGSGSGSLLVVNNATVTATVTAINFIGAQITSGGGTSTVNVSGIIAQSGSATAPANDPNENTVWSIPVPVLAANDLIEILTYWTVTANANGKTVRARMDGIGGTIFGSAAITSLAEGEFRVFINNQGATNSNQGWSQRISPAGNLVASARATGAVETNTGSVTIVITAQKATGTDTMTMTMGKAMLWSNGT